MFLRKASLASPPPVNTDGRGALLAFPCACPCVCPLTVYARRPGAPWRVCAVCDRICSDLKRKKGVRA